MDEFIRSFCRYLVRGKGWGDLSPSFKYLVPGTIPENTQEEKLRGRVESTSLLWSCRSQKVGCFPLDPRKKRELSFWTCLRLNLQNKMIYARLNYESIDFYPMKLF